MTELDADGSARRSTVGDILFQGLRNQNALQVLQDEFCLVAGVTSYCLDSDGERLTRTSGEAAVEDSGERGAMLLSYAERVLERVQDGALEDMATEMLPQGKGSVSALAIRGGGETLLYWVVYDFSDREPEKISLVLDLIRDICKIFYSERVAARSLSARESADEVVRYSPMISARESADGVAGYSPAQEDEVAGYSSAQEETDRDSLNSFTQTQIRSFLQSDEAITELVQLLDDEGQIEAVMERWLRILTRYLPVESAEIFHIYEDGKSMDLLCQWCSQGIASGYDKTRGLEPAELLLTEKPLIFSAGKEGEPHRKMLADGGWQSVMVFPVTGQESGSSMVFTAGYREEEHHFESAEVKLAADAIKILQSIMIRRIQKNSLAGSYAAAETILDNMACAVYVTDKKTGNLLFANRRLKNIFGKELRDKSFDAFLEQCRCQGEEGETFEVSCESKSTRYEMTYKEISWMDGRSAILYSLQDKECCRITIGTG